MASKDLMHEVEQKFTEVSNEVIEQHMNFILLNVWKMKFRGPITSKKLRRRGICYVFDIETAGTSTVIAICNKVTRQTEIIWPFTAERQKEYDTWCSMSAGIKHMQTLAMTGV